MADTTTEEWQATVRERTLRRQRANQVALAQVELPEPEPVVRRRQSARAPVVKIDVTADIIADAIPRSSSHCMIAEAVKVSVPGALRVEADLQTVRFTDPEKPYRYIYLTPRTGQVALVRFDQGIEVAPFRMTLKSGAVTRAGQRRTPGARTRATLAQREKRARDRELKRAETIDSTTPTLHDDTDRQEFVVKGGRTPPRAALSGGSGITPGKRRAFGLRALQF